MYQSQYYLPDQASRILLIPSHLIIISSQLLHLDSVAYFDSSHSRSQSRSRHVPLPHTVKKSTCCFAHSTSLPSLPPYFKTSCQTLNSRATRLELKLKRLGSSVESALFGLQHWAQKGVMLVRSRSSSLLGKCKYRSILGKEFGKQTISATLQVLTRNDDAIIDFDFGFGFGIRKGRIRIV